MTLQKLLNEEVVKKLVEEKLVAGEKFELISLETGEKMVFGEQHEKSTNG